jgi:hypothetical protein
MPVARGRADGVEDRRAALRQRTASAAEPAHRTPIADAASLSFSLALRGGRGNRYRSRGALFLLLPPRAGRRSREGTKGPRLHDWAYFELADLDAVQHNSALAGEWTRGLLIRRNIADSDLAFFSTWCPKGVPNRTSQSHVESVER